MFGTTGSADVFSPFRTNLNRLWSSSSETKLYVSRIAGTKSTPTIISISADPNSTVLSWCNFRLLGTIESTTYALVSWLTAWK